MLGPTMAPNREMLRRRCRRGTFFSILLTRSSQRLGGEGQVCAKRPFWLGKLMLVEGSETQPEGHFCGER